MPAPGTSSSTRDFLGLPVATNSLDGGTDFAFGGATTADGTSERTVISNPDPFIGGEFSITIDNLGKQVDDYLGEQLARSRRALHRLGRRQRSCSMTTASDNVTATATNVAELVKHLARAGARNLLVPNVPPLGLIPNYKDDPERAADLNAASADYRGELNTDLDAAVATLEGEGITITLYRLDVYALFYRLAANPEDYGFTNITDSAQGNSDVDPDRLSFLGRHPSHDRGAFSDRLRRLRLLNGTAQPPAQALNLSSRLNVGTDDNVLIDGLIVTGNGPKKVLVRGLGPSLTVDGMPLANTLANPRLELYQGNTLIQSNDDWKDTQQTAIEATGTAPTNDLESALIATLDPGEYTVILRGENGGTGIGLVEAYDLDTTASSTLGNASTRGLVATGDDALIAGFIVGNGGSDTVVVRAIGPSLPITAWPIHCADPTLDLYDDNGAIIRSDDNWRDAQESLIQSTGLAPTNDFESAIIRSLEPGNYTAVVRGKDGGTGVALVEVYNLQ